MTLKPDFIFALKGHLNILCSNLTAYVKSVKLAHPFSSWSQCCLKLNHLETKSSYSGLFINVLLHRNGSSCQVLITRVIENQKNLWPFLQVSLGSAVWPFWAVKSALACVLLLLIFLTASPRKNRASILDREHWALSSTSVFATVRCQPLLLKSPG